MYLQSLKIWPFAYRKTKVTNYKGQKENDPGICALNKENSSDKKVRKCQIPWSTYTHYTFISVFHL